MIVALLLVAAVVALVALRSVQRRHLPAGPRGLPLLGYLPWLAGAEGAEGSHRHLARLARRYGAIYRLRLGALDAVVLSEPALIRRVLAMAAAAGRAPLRLTHGVMDGCGLICAQGALWSEQRRFVATFLRQMGASRAPGPRRDRLEAQIERHVTAAIAFLDAQAGAAVDPAEAFYHPIGSFMSELVFGRVYERDDALWRWMKHLQDEGVKHFGVAGPVNFLSFLRFMPKYRRVFDFIMEGKRATHEIYEQMIAEEAAAMAGDAEGAPDNLIRAFLRERARATPAQRQHYHDRQFVHLLADVFGAGLHTTLSSVCWYFLQMAAEAEVQVAIQAEIDGVLETRGARLADQGALPLLMASIAEVQRLRTVVPLGIPHGALDEIRVDGVRIPRGTMIIPLQWAAHHDARRWAQPDAFRLDHFLDAGGRFAKPDAFMPYQTGQRMCVGEEVARMLLFLIIANVMQHFTITCDGAVDFRGVNSITYCPLPHKLIFTPRTRKRDV